MPLTHIAPLFINPSNYIVSCKVIYFSFHSDSWELVVRWSSALLFCFPVRGRVVGLLIMGSLIFGIKKSLVTCFALPCSFHPTQCLGCGWECGLWGGWVLCILFTFTFRLFLNFAIRCIFITLFSFL